MNLCTLFDSKYLTKGIALVKSLTRFNQGCKIFVLAMDDATFDTLSALPLIRYECHVLRLSAVVTPEIDQARNDRTWAEFCWMMASHLCKFCMETFALSSISYLDADTYFFQDPVWMYDEIENAHICITPHRWTHKYAERLRVNGLYNVGWVYFDADVQAQTCLREWCNQTLEWCYNRTEEGRFADQGYLNDWPVVHGAKVIDHLGINLAPWNQEQYSYAPRGNQVNIGLIEKATRRSFSEPLTLINPGYEADPLIFFHFHEFSIRKGQPHYRSGYELHPFVAEHIYPVYEREIDGIRELLSRL